MKKFEFSKLVLALVIFSYFVGLAFGMYVIHGIIKTGDPAYIPTALCGMFSYIGAPVAVAIGFYSYKAKAENIEKIKKDTGLQQNIEVEEDEFPYGDASYIIEEE